MLRVPANFPTLQSAINETCDGDSVLVADGVYTGNGNRDIQFHGKAIAVSGEGRAGERPGGVQIAVDRGHAGDDP